MAFEHTIRPAETSDLANVVRLQKQLFVQDAGVYGSFVDLDWPTQNGLADLTNLVIDEDSVLFVAVSGDSATNWARDPDRHNVLGFLAGYVSGPSPTRHQVDFAILRSLFVEASHRGHGVGTELCQRFIRWAEHKGCAEAHVSAYATNEGAQRFYERHGFAAQSIQRSRPLQIPSTTGD